MFVIVISAILENDNATFVFLLRNFLASNFFTEEIQFVCAVANYVKWFQLFPWDKSFY